MAMPKLFAAGFGVPSLPGELVGRPPGRPELSMARLIVQAAEASKDSAQSEHTGLHPATR